MLKPLKSLFVIATVGLLLGGCKQELPKAVEQPPVFGTVQAMRTANDHKQLIYQSGQDPYEKNWGLAASYYVQVDGKEYPVHWEHAEKFNALKVGDKVNLHPTDYISCTGESDLKPQCDRLMRIYRSERRINPLGHTN